MTIMLSESVSRRRVAYHRSHTLSTLPTHLVQETDNSDPDTDTETSKLIPNATDSPIHTSGSTPDLDRLMATSGDENGKQRRQPIRKSAPLQVMRNGTKLFAESESGARAKRLGRTPSSTSMLLNKVKDRIREKVFQTSTEWPYAAAIIQERRQRSVDAFEARLARSRKSLEEEIEFEQVPLKDLHDKRKRARMKSEPIPALILTQTDSEVPPAEVARIAFRRRSISEDTYDRRPCLPKVKVDQPDSKAGIICSNEDLQAIVAQADSGKCPAGKKSPTAKKRSSLEPQLSIDSSSSTYSSKSARSGRTHSIEADLGQSVDIGPSRSHDVDEMTASCKPIQNRDVRIRDDRVSRSLSLQSANSIGMMPNTSPRGSKGSIALNDRRHSDRSEHQDKMSRIPTAESDVDVDDDDGPKAVQEVVFDEFGQTWDVYGAEFDPEVVGDAIQRHLVKLMKERSENAERETAGQSSRSRKSRETSSSFWLRFFCLFNRDQPSSS
ncbi:hypothetical protein LSH36_523g00031 [Paralvinella palmiformis]|uniref:G protein-regulated inducer of neurite outgrowth C-terminal domain-containing protein n=1 Tax=Paralvinella palmiformis TaxID=53620 RepID=A0AAD9MWF5_9ANNE|nr:hypothetical protein LSH36_523g00031 [Paralvinella palmiformis]